jgi:co-chaperonin GroES (HSP10)
MSDRYKFMARADWMLVKKVDPPQGKSEIVLPGNINSLWFWGKVIEVGPGRRYDDGRVIRHGIQKGNIVLLLRTTAQALKFYDEDLWVAPASAVVAIMGKDA